MLDSTLVESLTGSTCLQMLDQGGRDNTFQFGINYNRKKFVVHAPGVSLCNFFKKTFFLFFSQKNIFFLKASRKVFTKLSYDHLKLLHFVASLS
jgi:hypothetical protein